MSSRIAEALERIAAALEGNPLAAREAPPEETAQEGDTGEAGRRSSAHLLAADKEADRLGADLWVVGADRAVFLDADQNEIGEMWWRGEPGPAPQRAEGMSSNDDFVFVVYDDCGECEGTGHLFNGEETCPSCLRRSEAETHHEFFCPGCTQEWWGPSPLDTCCPGCGEEEDIEDVTVSQALAKSLLAKPSEPTTTATAEACMHGDPEHSWCPKCQATDDSIREYETGPVGVTGKRCPASEPGDFLSFECGLMLGHSGPHASVELSPDGDPWTWRDSPGGDHQNAENPAEPATEADVDRSPRLGDSAFVNDYTCGECGHEWREAAAMECPKCGESNLDNFPRQEPTLAERAVSAPGWRWLPGMLTLVFMSEGELWHSPWRTMRDPRGWVSVGPKCRGEAEDNPAALPDLDDPCTLGGLLALVREAWGDDRLGVQALNDGSWVIYGGPGRLGRSATEAEALVCALEQAPGGEE